MSADSVPSVQEHRDVLSEVVAVFLERNGRYQDLWRTMPKEESVLSMVHKMRRIEALSVRGVDCRDDVLDLMNYCTFFIMNGYAGDRP